MRKNQEKLGIKHIALVEKEMRGFLCEINQVSHHSDWDFNETQCIGLFHPKNKLVSVKIPYAKNFAKKPPLKSEQTFSILAIT